MCASCQGKREVWATVSVQKEARRRRRVKGLEGGRADDISTMKPFTNSWWGRVGELLFLHLYPDASDAVSEFGNRVPFDAQHRELGKVNVKTCGARKTPQGRLAWSFQIAGVRSSCDSAFLIGFSEAKDRVERGWSVPAARLPNTLKVMAPGSSEYSGEHEVSAEDIALLDRKFQAILQGAPSYRAANRPTRVTVEYERVLLGQIGEAMYRRLHPESDHVAARDPLSPFDFIDPDGVRVNVRVRRRSAANRDRWTFFRSSCGSSDAYFFIGLDPSAHEVEALLRVPAEAMKHIQGFSLAATGSSSWRRFQVNPVSLPLPVSDFVQVPDLERTHIQLSSLTKDLLHGMSEVEREDLLTRAFAYHRTLGFPFPAIPSDARLKEWVEAIRAYAPQGKDFPVNNAGLGFCSAYMPHRFKARNENADFSAFDAFQDDVRLRRALRFCLRGETPSLSRPSVRSSLTALNRTPTQFRPAVAYALVERYSPKGGRIFDPCAGWGGRLMGTVVAGRSYIGVEPVKATADALYHLGMRLCEHLREDRERVQILESTIQDVPYGFTQADFALTSPPYWTRELYEEGVPMSLEDWESTFLRPMFRKVATMLVNAGVFAVNISDIRVGRDTVGLKDIVVGAAEVAGFRLEESWSMLKAYFGGQLPGRSEPVLIFRRSLF